MSLDAYVEELGPLPPLLTIVGVGDGALLEALDRRGWQGRIVAFEPVAAHVAALRATPIYRAWKQANRLRLVQGPDFHGAVDACLAFYGPELRALAEPAFANRHPAETRLAVNAMAKAVRAVRANAESKQRLSAIYRRNTLLNASAIAAEGDVSKLSGLAAGVPVIIVAAGPSLDSQLDAVRDVQDKAIIISVDTALRPLLGAGISPHFVVGVDPSSTNAMHLVDLSGAESTWLVAEGSIDPHALAAFRGRVFACRIGRHDPWPWLEGQGLTVGPLRAWGSVVTTAFDLAVQMSAATIAFVGVDLAFSDGRPYCRGTSFEELWRRIEDWGTPMAEQWAASVAGWTRVDETDVRGTPCQSAPHLIAFRDWLVEQSEALRNVRIVNASGAGILKGPRIEQHSLTALAGDWPVVSVRPRIAERWTPHQRIDAAIRTLKRAEPSAIAMSLSTDAPPEVTWRQPDPVSVPRVRMTLPRARIHRHADGRYAFSFRTRAARRWMAASMIGEPRFFEGHVPLVSCATFEALKDARAGHFSTALDQIVFRPLTDSDPRFEGPEFSVEVPADLVNYEALPLDLVLKHGL